MEYRDRKIPVPVLFYGIEHYNNLKGEGIMTTTSKRTGTASSVPAGILVAAAASIIMTLGFSAIISYCIYNETMNWEQSGYCIMVMLLISSFAGGKCAYRLVKRQRFMVSVMAGALYWGLLLCFTALFFGGHFSAILETAGIIGAGCVTSVLIPAGKSGKQSQRAKRSIVKLNKNS